MPDWAINILKAHGLAGVFILVLIFAIIWMAKRDGTKDKQLRILNEQRATEREKLVQLLESSVEASRLSTNATEKRTEMIEKLSSSILAQANSNERLNDRVAGQAEMIKERLGDFKHVVDSLGEAHRTNSGLISEVRNLSVAHGTKLDAIMVAVSTPPRQPQSQRRRSKQPLGKK